LGMKKCVSIISMQTLYMMTNSSEDITGWRSFYFSKTWKGLMNMIHIFCKKRNVTVVFRLSTIQKCTITLRMFSYGIIVDTIDEYCWLGEIPTMEVMKCFISSMKVCFEATYSRQWTLWKIVFTKIT
jgi:hypothetical protein